MPCFFKLRVIPLFLLIIVFQTFSFHAQALKTVRLVSIDYPPFYGPSLPGQGVVTQIIKKAFKLSGVKVTVDFTYWARAKKLGLDPNFAHYGEPSSRNPEEYWSLSRRASCFGRSLGQGQFLAYCLTFNL